MAKQVEFGKFLIIECTGLELYAVCGSPGICDWCAQPRRKGYYIAVLNQWYCAECFEDWKKRAKYYPEDADVERRNFNYYASLFSLDS